ncbi:chloride transporter, ClC family [Teredinibacter turnerae T7901]|uniref:Chloride transporter, ClC family n=1 Tax=Teredinibacter turnerae (strain ATCC 39867 / T7901) TaxID=377629 RepID=C5BP50_TERTT|nr:chloride channel protein [Teredinibacter turnerae]ACR12327.1 chloride transporter, ClC family [Teredinibacter turnerae T7901]
MSNSNHNDNHPHGTSSPSDSSTTSENFFNRFRHSLAYIDALPQLTILGLIVGLFTGGVIVVFRLLTEQPLSYFMAGQPDNFESFSPRDRVIIIFSGILALALVLKLAGKKYRETSVGHVLDRTHNHQGKLPLGNCVVQFAGAVVALVSGQSVGREGPAVHLGAGAASQLGQWLRLPSNSMHTLVGCGVAAAIAASFDTPMAGVIFAMEVIMMEYTIVGFVPVILASVMGTAVSQAVFGKHSLLVGSSDMTSLLELPYMVFFGLLIALCAAVYIRLNIFALQFGKYPVFLRLFAAGFYTAVIAIFVPEIMGLGYDTVNAALAGKLTVYSLLIIAAAKLAVTPVVIGLGVPGGVIGPLMFIGACVGGVVGTLLPLLVPEQQTNASFYAVLGMAGMMAATLNAPLAALVAVLELSYNPHMIFPAMLVIVVACVSTRQFFRLNSIFIEQLNHSGRQLDFGPARQALRRAGVRSIMDNRFLTCSRKLQPELANQLLQTNPMWILFDDDGEKIALRAADLAIELEKRKETAPSSDEEPNAALDLLEIPGRRLSTIAIDDTANLIQALELFRQTGADGLYVAGSYGLSAGKTQGIVTLAAIQNYYQPKELKNVMG